MKLPAIVLLVPPLIWMAVSALSAITLAPAPTLPIVLLLAPPKKLTAVSTPSPVAWLALSPMMLPLTTSPVVVLRAIASWKSPEMTLPDPGDVPPIVTFFPVSTAMPVPLSSKRPSPVGVGTDVVALDQCAQAAGDGDAGLVV